MQETQETWVQSLSWEDPMDRCLVGYSPWGHKESDMPELLSTTNKDLLKRSGNYMQCLVITYDEKKSKKAYIYT